MGPEWKPLTDADPPYAPAEDYQLIEADPGDAIFFDSYVPHGSPGNASARPRRNIYLTFNRRADGDLRRRYYDDKWVTYPPNRPGEERDDKSYRV
jgi:ectoine hydroxylase-related dioxygenase (phytanoyl-CoA dioxygenase family)